MAKKYRGRRPKTTKTIRNGSFSPDSFFGLSSILKNLFSFGNEKKKDNVGDISNVKKLDKFNITDLLIPTIFNSGDENYNTLKKNFETNQIVKNFITKTYNTGGLIQNFASTAREYIDKRSFVPESYPETWKKAKERAYGPFRGLSDEKLGSVFAYTDEKSRIFEKINNFLRFGKEDDDIDNIKSIISDLTGALQELSQPDSEKVELFRVVSGDYAEKLSSLELGDTFEEKGFGSWAGGKINNPLADQFIKKDTANVILTTESDKAVNIAPISRYEQEKEHIVPPNQKYEVVNKTPDAVYSRKLFASIPQIDLKQFNLGGKITSRSGRNIRGAGVDTQLIAAQPGEVVINKRTVDSIGADYFLGLNKTYGGPSANKPKVAKNIQSASGGGIVNFISSFVNGGTIKYGKGNIGENLDKIRQEITEEGTIGGEKLTPEQRKQAFKSRRDKVAFKNFVENFLGVKDEPRTQTGGGTGRGGGVGAPPSGPGVRMLPGTSVSSLVARKPDTQRTSEQRKQPEQEVEQVRVQDVTKKKRTKVGDSLESNVKIIRKTVDSIFKTLSDQNKFFGKQAENERKALENQKRTGKEEKFEAGKDKKFKKAFEKTVKPFSNILDGILNYLTAIFLGRAFVKLMDWLGDPDNQGKIKTIGRFFKDWWPALLGAYLIFGNSFTRFALGFIAKVGIWTARMAAAVIPKLLGAIAKNPKAAAAAGLFTAGATVPLLFPQTVNEQERATEKASAEKGADKVRQDLERKANSPNFFERLTGQDSEAREQLSKMETGETKSYGFRRGGKVTTQSGKDIKGAGVDTQLIAARPGEVVINKETVDRIGADYFLGLNKKYGGPNANKPKVAKNVQAASGGGLVLPAFANGGMVGESNERPIGGTYMGQRGKKLEKFYDEIPKKSEKQSTGSLITDPVGALGRIVSRSGVSIPNIGGFTLPQLDKMTMPSVSMPSFTGMERERDPGKSSTGSFLTDPFGALGRITSSTGLQVPRVPPLPSLSTITGGATGKPSAPKPPTNQEPGIAENMLKSPTFRDSGLLYLRSMFGGIGGPITEQQLSKESKSELEKAIARAKTRTSSELKVAEAQLKEAKDGGFNKQILAERQSVVNRLKSGQVRVKYQDYFEDGKISKSAEDAKSVLGQFWAQATSDGGYRVVNEKYDFVEMPDPLAVLKGDSTGVAPGAKPGQPITLRQKLQALHQLNPLARSMEVDMILGKKKGDPGRTLVNTARMIARSVPPNLLISDTINAMKGDQQAFQTPQQKANQRKLEEQRPWWDKFGLFGGATAEKQRQQKNKPVYGPGGSPTGSGKGQAQQKPKPKPKLNKAQKLYGASTPTITKTKPPQRAWYDPRGWIGKQGGGEITESTGMNMPGAGADRQLIATQPGEYILPVDTVMRLGGPKSIDRLVAATDSNSTAAKIGTLSKPRMAVEQPVMSDDMSMVSTLPPIVQSTGTGGYGGGGVATQVPVVNVSSNSSRRSAKTMYGLV